MTVIYRSLFALVLTFAAVLTSVPASAHGLLMKLDAEGRAITGQVYFSNGAQAGGVWVELLDEKAPDTAIQTVQTTADGTFGLEGELGHNYLVRASGEEGHHIAMAIALGGAQARGAMVEEPAQEAAEQGFELPAWAILGGLLILSLLPAFWLRRRDRARRAASQSLQP